MGAREPLSGPLTPTQRETVVDFVEAQVGKDYQLWPIADGPKFGLGPGDLAKGADQFNCVGLAEMAYEVAGVNGGQGLIDAGNEKFLLTPAEQYNQTKPAGGAPPTPEIVSAIITPNSGTECTIVTLKIGVIHNYGLDYVAAVTYKAANGFTNPTLHINDEGKQGDHVAGDGTYSVQSNAGRPGDALNTSSVRIDVTVTDLYGRTDTASVTYSYTGTCNKQKKAAARLSPLVTEPSL